MLVRVVWCATTSIYECLCIDLIKIGVYHAPFIIGLVIENGF
jgi:hypothetical protein